MLPATYRFGPFVLDPDSYRLLKRDLPLPLSPKALDLLLLLVTRPAALLTKDDILAALWPDVAVTDNAITQVVSEVRQALEDDPASPLYIETVPRRGYRFVGAVQTVAVAPPGAPSGGGGSAARPRTIAVQDFLNVTGETDIAWLASGLAETVTNDLRAIREVHVIDRAVLARAGSSVAASQAARPDIVVAGSFQRSGDQLRIMARAIDPRTKAAVAHAKADGALADVFQLQDAIVTQLSSALQIRVTPHAEARIRARETSSLDAYRALTQGRLKLEALDVSEVPGAIQDFERAIELDPQYALAYVGLAHAGFWRFQASRARNRPDREALDSAIANARRAVEIDPELAEGHAALALLLAGAERPREAVAAGRIAVALEPSNWRHQFRLGTAAWGQERLDCLDAVVAVYPQLAYAHFGIAMVHVARGDLARADQVLRRGVEADAARSAGAERFPGGGLHWLLGLIRLASGDAAEARVEFDREVASKGRALFADEFAMDAFDGLGFAQLESGDAAGAAAMFTRALEQYPDHARSLLGLSDALLRQGQHSQAGAAVAQAGRAIDELHKGGRTSEALLATAFSQALAGNRSDAIGTLDRLMAEAPPGFAGWTLGIEPLLASLRGDPAFTAVLVRLAERAR
jgi:DNA-binding winged helix-turn-helix (wHTH) protein/tetratricopeptide (TPR) repeat protein